MYSIDYYSILSQKVMIVLSNDDLWKRDKMILTVRGDIYDDLLSFISESIRFTSWKFYTNIFTKTITEWTIV